MMHTGMCCLNEEKTAASRCFFNSSFFCLTWSSKQCLKLSNIYSNICFVCDTFLRWRTLLAGTLGSSSKATILKVPRRCFDTQNLDPHPDEVLNEEDDADARGAVPRTRRICRKLRIACGIHFTNRSLRRPCRRGTVKVVTTFTWRHSRVAERDVSYFLGGQGRNNVFFVTKIFGRKPRFWKRQTKIRKKARFLVY